MKTKFNSSASTYDNSNQKHLTFIGIGIGIIWIVVSILFKFSSQSVTKYALCAPDGLLLVQLLTYSFIHFFGLHLIFHLVALFWIISYAKMCLSLHSFIRLYSLGSIGGGIIYILMNQILENTIPIIGAGIPIMACIGALVVMAPRGHKSQLIFWTIINVGWITIFTKIPAIKVGLLAGLIFGLIYGLIEKIWMHFNSE